MTYLKQGFALAFLALANTTLLLAAEPPLRPTEFNLGPYWSAIKYQEPGVMHEEGTLFGVVGRFSSHTGFAATILEASYASGNMDYKGSGVIEGIPDILYELRALLGRDFYSTAGYRVTPFVGLGYRNLNDDSSGKVSSTNRVGYEREQVYFYNPIGIEFKALPNGLMWAVSGRVEYDGLIKGVNHSYLSDVEGNSDIKLKQTAGHGVRVAVSFEKPLSTQGGGVIIEPFYKHWNIAKSNVVSNAQGNWIEPANHSNEWGVALMLSF